MNLRTILATAFNNVGLPGAANRVQNCESNQYDNAVMAAMQTLLGMFGGNRSVEREAVYGALDGERDYQDRKWGLPNKNKPVAYAAYMQDYLNQALRELTRATTPKDVDAALCSIRKVTALGVACLEEHGAVTREQETERKISHVVVNGAPSGMDTGISG